MYKMKISLMTGLGLLMLTAALVLSGCSSKSVKDDVSGEDVSFVVTVSPPIIAWNESIVIEAVLTNGTDPVVGQMISFSVEPDNAGYFTPQEVATDDAGVAAAVYNPYSTGSQMIVVSTVFGDGAYNKSVGIEVTESYESAEGNVEISLGKSLLLADGADSTPVLITVRDAVGQRVPDSTLLICIVGEKFVDNDSNGFWSNGIDWLAYDANGNYTWDAIGTVPTYAVTGNDNGTAQITYQAGNDAGTAYLKVTVADASIGGSGEVAIQLKADADVNSIYLSSDSINLCVKQTGGIESTQLRATGYDVNGNAVPEGIPITFIITDGPGGGEHLNAGGYGPYTGFTNSQGVASIALHSGTVSGTIRIRAYADTVLSNATQVMVSAGPPAYIVVAAEECNVSYWDDVAAFNLVVAIVSDVYLNPVNDSTVVYFWTDEGTMKSHEERTEELEGIAYTKWFAGNNVPTANGRVWIYAETAGGTVVDSSMFYNSHWPDTLICTGVPASILADGKSKYYVWVDGLDLNDNPVEGGTSFEADALLLSVSGGMLQNGCYAASDRVEISSKLLELDASLTGGNDDGIGAYDWVTYWHPAGAVSTFQVALTTVNAYAGSSTLQKQGSPGAGETAYFTATIKDRFGNPLGDHTLTISPPSGAAVPSSVNTNAYGEAIFSWVVPVVSGDYTIIVQDTDPRGGIVLSVTITVEE